MKEIKKTYGQQQLEHIWRHQKSTEDLVREILSKVCPMHGKHANIQIKKDGKLIVSACCEEFHEMIENIIRDHEKLSGLQ